MNGAPTVHVAPCMGARRALSPRGSISCKQKDFVAEDFAFSTLPTRACW